MPNPLRWPFWPGKAVVSLVDGNTLNVHLTSNLMNFDTILQYKIQCYVVEVTGTCTKLFTDNNVEKGGYNDEVKYIQFCFGYHDCINNTFFEGDGEN